MCTVDAAAAIGNSSPMGFNSAPYYAASSTPSWLTAGNATAAAGALNAVGGAVTAASSAGNTATAYGLQAGNLDNNALIAEQAAASAITTGKADAANAYMKGAQTLGAQRAALAANGVDLNTGSAANLQASTNYVTDQNVATITANAARAAMGYGQQEQADQRNAAIYRSAAGAINPIVSGASTLLTGASSVASNWYKAQTAGVQ